MNSLWKIVCSEVAIEVQENELNESISVKKYDYEAHKFCSENSPVTHMKLGWNEEGGGEEEKEMSVSSHHLRHEPSFSHPYHAVIREKASEGTKGKKKIQLDLYEFMRAILFCLELKI
ncbi:hypothetical protein C0J52_00277 [Blattella germanica]|nr:hypothetical protein C0J52_00277 [Blattella germanica]